MATKKKSSSSSAAAQRRRQRNRILSEKSSWPVQEAYRVLRTNIQFTLPGEGNRVIGVTSAFQHDGKSTNALNVAISFGQLDKKVLLIDCDLRKPSIDGMLKVPGKPGLSDVLAGMATLEESLQHLEDRKIDLLPGGHIPPDATMLLQSSAMKKLINRLKGSYEYIIIDLPPVTAVTDAVILSEVVDGYLVVVRHKVTDYRAVSDTIEQLRFAEGNILGFIYNDYAAEGSKYGYGYGGYGGSGYGYGYGHEAKQTE